MLYFIYAYLSVDQYRGGRRRRVCDTYRTALPNERNPTV